MKRAPTINAGLVTFTLFLIASGCSDSSQSTAAMASIRGVRYCEVIAVKNEGGFSADVYGTQGLSDCPPSSWEALDPESIQEELGAFVVVMNGPRFWLIDGLVSFSELGESRFFGELEMRRIATLMLSPEDLSQAPYEERSVVRDTEFVFLSGSEVYELVAPDGTVYVMQSYAHIVDDTLDEAALQALGDRLSLPEGWLYRVRVVEEDYIVVDRDGIAIVVQDELQNTYQRVDLPD